MAKEDFKKDRWFYLSDATRHQNHIPDGPGIYCFIEFNLRTKRRRAIYVGKSEQLPVRLKLGHKAERVYRIQFSNANTILFLKVMITDRYHEKEIEYIKKLRPIFNVCHNPIIQRKINYTNGQTIH